MIIWRSKETPETRDGFPCAAFRWVLEVTRWGVHWEHQHQYKEEPGKWHSSHVDSYGVSLHAPLRWGAEHVYYDGPHCFFSAGFVHVQWGGNWACRECLPDEDRCAGGACATRGTNG